MTSKFLDERVFEPGDIIFREGDPGTEMYLLQEGKVVISKAVGNSEVFLALLERGEFFGEMALFDAQPRHATCKALTRTRVAVVKSGELLMKLRRDPTLALEMLQTMSRRIRYLDDQLVALVGNHDASSLAINRVIARAEFLPEAGR